MRGRRAPLQCASASYSATEMRLLKRIAYWIAVVALAILLTYALTRLAAGHDEWRLDGAAAVAWRAVCLARPRRERKARRRGRLRGRVRPRHVLKARLAQSCVHHSARAGVSQRPLAKRTPLRASRQAPAGPLRSS
jgi:hypothetical protein